MRFQVQQQLKNGEWEAVVTGSGAAEFIWIRDARKFIVDFRNRWPEAGELRIVVPTFTVVE